MSDPRLRTLNNGYPVFPIPPMFDMYGALDLDETRKYVTYLEDHGARVFMTTQGTSQFDLLEDDEIVALNIAVAEVTNCDVIMGVPNRLSFIRNGCVDALLEVASRRRRSAGSEREDTINTALMYLYPGRYYGDGSEMVSWLFEQANYCDKHKIPVLVHGMWMRGGTGGIVDFPTKNIIDIGSHRNIIGMKEETRSIDSAMSILASVEDALGPYPHDRFDIIVAGGSMRRFNALRNGYRVKTWLTGVGNIIPEIEAWYGNNHDRKEMLEAEKHFFETTKKIGWHLSLREGLRLAGVAKFSDRQPFPYCSEEQRAELQEAIDRVVRVVNGVLDE